VFVGVTDGELARRDRVVPGWRARADVVEEFWRDAGFAATLTVRALTDPDGPAASSDYDAIVVSPETVLGAARINKRRDEAGRSALAVRVVPHVLAADLLPVSGTRIAAGDIDRAGRRKSPVRVAVGSTNPVKSGAVRAALASILGGVACEISAVDVPAGVPGQPRDDETLDGARARARAARRARPDCDYSIGIEAGLNQDPAGEAWYDAQACVVADALGQETDGWGPAFRYPDWVTRRALAGEMVSEILGPVAGDPRIGGTTGAIGFLTEGVMDRAELTRIAVVMAFVPRIKRTLYTIEPAHDERKAP
jgi:pantetheine-phosphate adenylyltransferase